MTFQNKTVLITGASSGLGAELAVALSEQGANLALFARNRERLESVGNQCAHPPLLISGDVTKAYDCERAIQQTVKIYNQIDYLILNAGVSMWARFDEISDPKVFQTIMDTNYLGPVYFTHYALPFLKKSKGMIVPISSIQGKITVPYHTGYAASKHALEGFFEALRCEVDVGILVVSPSWIQGTQLKNNAIAKNHSRKKGSQGIPVKICAEKIISAMLLRKSQLILPKKYRLLPLLKFLCPQLLKWMIHRAVNSKR